MTIKSKISHLTYPCDSCRKRQAVYKDFRKIDNVTHRFKACAQCISLEDKEFILNIMEQKDRRNELSDKEYKKYVLEVV